MSAARFDLPRRLLAEALGTAFLLATVVGSGIMAERLADGNVALALLANAIPTGAMLVVLITMFGPISGAHFNPAVTLCFFMRREIGAPDALAYVAAQLVGAAIGTWCAHLMFDMPILMLGGTVRAGIGQWVGEAVATFGLVAAILGLRALSPEGGGGGGRSVHHRGLLVHVVDLVRQPGGHGRPRADRQLRRHPARRRARIHRRAAGGRAGGLAGCRLALS